MACSNDRRQRITLARPATSWRTPRLKSRKSCRLFLASGGASGSRMDQDMQERHGHCLAEAAFILSPSARTGPSRLGPAGEGRSDGGVLHLHSPGQARYPEGGRRREDEPPGRGGAFAPIPTRRRAPGRRPLGERFTRGLAPPYPRVWLRSPRFFTPYRPTRTRQDLPCTSAGEPRTP